MPPGKYDVIAAGVAVAAYSTFFAMPWRMVPIPVVIGMLAHAARWATISVAGASVETGALVAPVWWLGPSSRRSPIGCGCRLRLSLSLLLCLCSRVYFYSEWPAALSA